MKNVCVGRINAANWDSEISHKDLSEEAVRTAKLNRHRAQTKDE